MLFSALFFSTANIVSLDTLDPAAISAGSGTPRIDRSIQGRPLRIGGREFSEGIGTHAPSEWPIALHRRAKEFRATVGVDEETNGSGTVEFQVVADGKIVAQSGVLHHGQSMTLRASLKGAEAVILRVTDGGDGNSSDHADWCDAAFTMDGPKDQPESILPAPIAGEKWIYPVERNDPPLPLPIVELPLYFISTADDDGGAARNFPKTLIPGIVRYMNDCYREARTHFSYNPDRDFEEIRSTVLNRDFKPDAAVYSDEKTRPPEVDFGSGKAREDLAFKYPDKFVVVCRRGSAWEWSAQNKRWEDHITYGNYGGGYIFTPAGSDDPELFVHESGHSLGLPHTFGERPKTVAEAAALIRAAIDRGLPPDRGLEAFDGDRDVVKDTASDVSNEGIYGSRPNFKEWPTVDIPVTLADGSKRIYSLRPDPFNHMSYFGEARGVHPKANRILGHFSREQIIVVRRRAEQRLDDTGRVPDHSRTPGTLRYEFEEMKPTATAKDYLVQDMQEGFVTPGAKPGRQVFVRSGQGERMGYRFEVPKSGRYQIWWAGSYAPDYGIFGVTLDEKPLTQFDAWMPSWMATGWRRFGVAKLSKGSHEIVFSADAKNSMASDYHMGLDALSLQPVR